MRRENLGKYVQQAPCHFFQQKAKNHRIHQTEPLSREIPISTVLLLSLHYSVFIHSSGLTKSLHKNYKKIQNIHNSMVFAFPYSKQTRWQ